MASTPLYTFSSPPDVQRFQITTDRVLGGRSDASLRLKAYPSFASGVFEGVIDYPQGGPDGTQTTSKGGFASFRTKADERVRDLSAFEGVELRVKTDGRG